MLALVNGMHAVNYPNPAGC